MPDGMETDYIAIPCRSADLLQRISRVDVQSHSNPLEILPLLCPPPPRASLRLRTNSTPALANK